MPRTTKFDRQRMNKLLGVKHKPIKKQDEDKMYIKPLKTLPTRLQIQLKNQNIKSQPPYNRPFKASNYIEMQKIFYVKHHGQQIHKSSFRCYTDNQIFGDDIIDFTNKVHDQDHDTPPEQARFDVSIGIKKLKESLETYVPNTQYPESTVIASQGSKPRSQGSKGFLRYQIHNEHKLFFKKPESSNNPNKQENTEK